MQKRKNYIKYICLIVLILICIILSLFYKPENVVNTEEKLFYKNIGINSNELNILYLNVGQADSTLITMGEDVKENGDNDTSIVIQLNYKDNKFLFMGDATSKVEKQLLNNNKLGEIDVLKVGHHGSNSSSSEKFLNTVLPKYSIISVNNLEYSKHPSENTIERLNSIHSEIYRTDVNGTIWITSDGITIEIEKLDINLNGNNKHAIILLEDRKYFLIFLC